MLWVSNHKTTFYIRKQYQYLLLITIKIGLTVYTDEEFEAAFEKVDRDGSGYITPNEVEELLYETYGYPALEEEIKMFMEDFDANHDGKVSKEEFKAALTRMRE